MRKILTSFSILVASLAFAQVGINADGTDIAKDAVFHVKNKANEAKGVILPVVSLASSTDQATITGASGSVTTGLMVWNDGKAGLKPVGYYYWDGVKWLLTGNVTSKVNMTHFSNSNYTLKSTDEVVVCDQGATLQVIIPASEFVEGRHFVLLNNNCSGGLIINDEQGQNVLSGNSTNTDLQEGIGQSLYYDGHKWMNTTGY